MNPATVSGGIKPAAYQRGERIFDCAQEKVIRDRLAFGLTAQADAIKRTEALLEASREGLKEAREEAKRILIKGALEEAKEYAEGFFKESERLRRQIEKLKGMSKKKRGLIIRSLHTIAFHADDLLKAAKAGNEAGREVQKKTQDLVVALNEFNKLMEESNIAEESSKQYLGKLWGPSG